MFLFGKRKSSVQQQNSEIIGILQSNEEYKRKMPKLLLHLKQDQSIQNDLVQIVKQILNQKHEQIVNIEIFINGIRVVRDSLKHQNYGLFNLMEQAGIIQQLVNLVVQYRDKSELLFSNKKVKKIITNSNINLSRNNISKQQSRNTSIQIENNYNPNLMFTNENWNVEQYLQKKGKVCMGLIKRTLQTVYKQFKDNVVLNEYMEQENNQKQDRKGENEVIKEIEQFIELQNNLKSQISCQIHQHDHQLNHQHYVLFQIEMGFVEDTGQSLQFERENEEWDSEMDILMQSVYRVLMDLQQWRWVLDAMDSGNDVDRMVVKIRNQIEIFEVVCYYYQKYQQKAIQFNSFKQHCYHYKSYKYQLKDNKDHGNNDNKDDGNNDNHDNKYINIQNKYLQCESDVKSESSTLESIISFHQSDFIPHQIRQSLKSSENYKQFIPQLISLIHELQYQQHINQTIREVIDLNRNTEIGTIEMKLAIRMIRDLMIRSKTSAIDNIIIRYIDQQYNLFTQDVYISKKINQIIIYGYHRQYHYTSYIHYSLFIIANIFRVHDLYYDMFTRHLETILISHIQQIKQYVDIEIESNRLQQMFGQIQTDDHTVNTDQLIAISNWWCQVYQIYYHGQNWQFDLELIQNNIQDLQQSVGQSQINIQID